VLHKAVRQFRYLPLLLAACATSTPATLSPTAKAAAERRIGEEAIIGTRLFRKGQYHAAIKHLERVFHDIERLGGHRYLDGTLHYLATAHALVGQFKEAHAYCKALIELRGAAHKRGGPKSPKSEHHRHRLAQAWRDVGWIRFRSGHLDWALAANAEALRVISPEHSLLLSSIYYQRSRILEDKGDIKGALASAQQVFVVVKKQAALGHAANADVFGAALRLARLYRTRLHDYPRAESAIKTAQKYVAPRPSTSTAPSLDQKQAQGLGSQGQAGSASKLNPAEQHPTDESEPTLRSRALLELARLRCAQSRYREARDVARKALALSENAGSSLKSAAILEVVNSSYYLEDIDTVLKHADDGIEIARDNTKRTLQFLNAKGSALALLGKSGDALKALKRALALSRSIKEPSETSATLNNIAFALLIAGDFSSAQTHLKSAYKIDQKARDQVGLCFDLANLGIAEELAGSPQAATEHLKMALKLSQRIGHPRTHLKAVAALGRIALAQGKKSDAVSLFDKGLDEADRLKLNHWRWRFRLLTARAAIEQRRDTAARDLLEQAVGIIAGIDPKVLGLAVPKGLEKPRQVFVELIKVQRRLGDDDAALKTKQRMNEILSSK